MSSVTERQTDWVFRVWGCRGGVPTWGPGVARYGGHTTCLELDLPEARIVIDAGSGLCEMGRVRGHDGKPTLLLMSHLHWDHVIGLPHWSPIYTPGWDLTVRGVEREGLAPIDWLLDFNRPPVFPVHLRETVKCNIRGDSLPLCGNDVFAGVRYEWMEVAHPGGCSAFALVVGSRRLVFSGDLELPRMDLSAFAAFCKGAEALIIDGQYNDAEYPRFDGWGHSSNLQAARFAADVGVKALYLTHHDPRKDDTAVDGLVEQARRVFPQTHAVYCGMDLAWGSADDLG